MLPAHQNQVAIEQERLSCKVDVFESNIKIQQ